MLLDIKETEILKKKTLNKFFLSATLKDIGQNCKIFKNDFYLDSFNYFPISKNFETFFQLFKRDDINSVNHFYSEKFYKNFSAKIIDFKVIKNSFVLGSSPADNYFTNLLHFFPRIFFTNEKKINLIIHRNLSNKFRNLIQDICTMREVDITFNFIDDGFYKFENSLIPQFFNIEKSINILKFFLDKILENVEAPKFKPKIYIRREDANYRKIVNEADLITKLRDKGFDIINPQHFEILTQMKIFSNAELIISPHGSNLSNIIFCKPRTKIIEFCPNINSESEKQLLTRYKNIAKKIDLNYSKINVDSVDISNYPDLVKKYINADTLKKSNYYKNLIIKVSEIDKLINNL